MFVLNANVSILQLDGNDADSKTNSYNFAHTIMVYNNGSQIQTYKRVYLRSNTHGSGRLGLTSRLS